MNTNFFIDTMGSQCVSIGPMGDSDEAREKLVNEARAALLKYPGEFGYRFTGSILRSENPNGLVGIIAWKAANNGLQADLSNVPPLTMFCGHDTDNIVP